MGLSNLKGKGGELAVNVPTCVTVMNKCMYRSVLINIRLPALGAKQTFSKIFPGPIAFCAQ